MTIFPSENLPKPFYTKSLHLLCLSPNNIVMMIGLASQFEGILTTKKEGRLIFGV
jgi:hypothetical protein